MNKLGSFLTSPLGWFCSSSVSEVVLNAAAKSFGFSANYQKQKTFNSVRLLKMGLNEKGLFYK